MYKSYKLEIKPTFEQSVKINKTIGVSRFLYNFYLSYNKELYEKENKFISGYDFSKYLNNEFIPNNPSYSWIKEVSSKANKQAIMNGDAAFKRFFRGESKFPRYKKKNHNTKASIVKNNKTDYAIERHRIKIPTLGFVRVKEYGYLPLDANVKSGTLSMEADKYYLSVLVEEKPKTVNVFNYTEGIGVDLGLKDFVITSDNKVYKNINKSKKTIKLEKKLKREQRRLSRKRRGGANSHKNKIRVQKLHMKLRNKRVEYVKYVVNSLVKQNPKFISIENLNISGMMKNRHLSKAIQSQNFYYFKLFLTQQCKKREIDVRVVDRWYPSSKLCSQCGNIKKDLKLSDRTYRCECGFEMDRDLNASINIKNCETYIIAN